MTKYEIKGYQPGFETAQERIGIEVAQDWLWPHQSPVQRLKALYTQPTFDPETRLYCFMNNEMVGFITASQLTEKVEGEVKRAELEPPRVLPGYEEVNELLVNKAIEVLQKKGIKIIQARISSLWGDRLAFAEKWGFQLKEEQSYYYQLDITSAKDYELLEQVKDFNPERDLEDYAKFLAAKSDTPIEEVRKLLDFRVERLDQIIAFLMIRENEKIVASCLAAPNRLVPKEKGALYELHIEDASHLQQFLPTLIKACQNKGIETFFVDFKLEEQQLGEIYQSFGFKKIGSFSIYEKVIE